MRKPLKVSGSIGHARGSREEDYFTFSLIDEASRCTIVEVRLTPVQFASFVTGSHCALEAYVYDNAEYWGKTRENKAVAIPYPEDLRERDAWIAETAAHMERRDPPWRYGVEKWNWHRAEEGKYRFHAYRFVDPEN